MGESVIRMKPITHENEKIRAKTGEQKMGFARKDCENVKKKEEMGERDLDKGTFAHYILRIAGCMLLSFQNQEKGLAK